MNPDITGTTNPPELTPDERRAILGKDPRKTILAQHDATLKYLERGADHLAKIGLIYDLDEQSVHAECMRNLYAALTALIETIRETRSIM